MKVALLLMKTHCFSERVIIKHSNKLLMVAESSTIDNSITPRLDLNHEREASTLPRCYLAVKFYPHTFMAHLTPV